MKHLAPALLLPSKVAAATDVQPSNHASEKSGGGTEKSGAQKNAAACLSAALHTHTLHALMSSATGNVPDKFDMETLAKWEPKFNNQIQAS